MPQEMGHFQSDGMKKLLGETRQFHLGLYVQRRIEAAVFTHRFNRDLHLLIFIPGNQKRDASVSISFFINSVLLFDHKL